MRQSRRSNLDTLKDCWSRWTEIIALFAGSRPGWRQVDPQDYANLRGSLIAACRSLAEAHGPTGSYYAALEQEVDPWMDLDMLAHTDQEILKTILERCSKVEQELRGKRERPDDFRLVMVLIASGLVGFVVASLFLAMGSPAITAMRDVGDTIWTTIAYTDRFVKWSVIALVILVVAMYGVSRTGLGWR
jgi:hypothetical protein